jgi:hypothetical protein
MLAELEIALEHLLQLHEKRQFALAKLDTAELERLAQDEIRWAAALEALQQRRLELLAGAEQVKTPDAEAVARPPASLRDLVALGAADRRPALYEQITRIEKQLAALHNLAVTNWLASFRSSQFVEAILADMQVSAAKPRPDAAGRVFDSSA